MLVAAMGRGGGAGTCYACQIGLGARWFSLGTYYDYVQVEQRKDPSLHSGEAVCCGAVRNLAGS